MYAYSELESPHRVAARLFHANEWRQHSFIFLQWSSGLYPIPLLPQTGYRYVCGVKCGLKQYKALSVSIQTKLFTRYVKLINVQAGAECKESRATDSLRNSRLNQFLLKKTENACNARSSFGLCNTSCTVTSHQSRDQISAMHWCG